MNLALRTLRSAEGRHIAALDYEPRRPRNVALAVGHGYSSSKHNLDSLCAFLASHGFGVISLDFPGHKLGASGGRLDGARALVDALGAAVTFARAEYGPHVYALGHSMGAMAALLTCAGDPLLTGAVSIATGYGRPARLEAFRTRGTVDLRSRYVDGLSLMELVSEVEPLLDAALPALAGRPVLYVAAERDGMVSRASVEELFRRAPEPKTFATVASDHTYAGENSRATVLAWLGERHRRE
jgi:pimeloyl-ACP methyl ester carboxylesterase